MIAHLRGTLLTKLPTQAIVEAAGVGYAVAITVPTYTALPAEGQNVALHIHTEVREDTLALFGFLALAEKRLFERLTTVPRLGPKLAMTILSGLTPEAAITALRAQDHATLTRIPGVGKRLAELAIVQLKDKLDDLSAPAATAYLGGDAADDVLSALVNLGYQRPAAQKAISTAIARDKSANEEFDTLFRATLRLIR